MVLRTFRAAAWREGSSMSNVVFAVVRGGASNPEHDPECVAPADFRISDFCLVLGNLQAPEMEIDG